MSLPRHNLRHDQEMDEIQFFISRFGYDPRAPPQWVHPIDIPQQDVIDTPQPSTIRRHPANIRDPPRRNTRSPSRNTRSPRRNTRSPRRNTGGKTRKRKSRKNKK